MNQRQQQASARANQRIYQSTTKIPTSAFRLQQILFFEYYYHFIYIILTISCITFKSQFLTYPRQKYFNWEINSQVCLYILTFSKIRIGNLGNKSENSGVIRWYMILNLGTIIGFVFLMWFQTFVLQLEFIGNLIGFIFSCFGLLLGVFAYGSFKNSERSMYN